MHGARKTHFSQMRQLSLAVHEHVSLRKQDAEKESKNIAAHISSRRTEEHDFFRRSFPSRTEVRQRIFSPSRPD